MGNMKDLLGMIPGMGKALKDVDVDDGEFNKIEAIIYSMTMEEENPPILNEVVEDVLLKAAEIAFKMLMLL